MFKDKNEGFFENLSLAKTDIRQTARLGVGQNWERWLEISDVVREPFWNFNCFPITVGAAAESSGGAGTRAWVQGPNN